MPDIESLGRKLHSSDAEERREAAVDLGRAGRPAVPFLFKALMDADWRVRKTSVEALVALADREVVAGLVQALAANDNAGARNSAIEALIHIGAGALDVLLPSLETNDPDVRKFIVDILGEIRDSRGVPPLISILSDPDENIRVAAAEALGKIKDPRAVDSLLACLSRHDQGWLDYAAAEALGEIGDERALAPLIAALGTSSLREPVIEALGKIGDVATLSPIISGLGDPLRIVREVSLTALIAIYKKSTAADRETIVSAVQKGSTDRIVNLLEEMLITSAGKLQKAAVAALGWTGRESSIPKMLELLREEDMEEPIVQALIKIDDARTALLIRYLASENALVRRTVARVLGGRGRHEAEDSLIQLLADENGHVRSNAAEALGQLRSKKAISALLDLLTDEYESVQESGIRALAAIGDESVLDSLTRDFTARDAPLRKNIALLLGQFSTEKAVEALAFALKDEEPSVRKAAVQALGNQSGEQARRSLMLAVTDDEPEVRMIAADALGSEASQDAAEALTLLLQDPDLWVRATAARGLGKIGGAECGSLLAEHLTTASDIFLLALIDVLGRLKAEPALHQFLKLAGHADPEVRKSVLSALAGYPWDAVRQTVFSLLSDPHWSVRKTAIEILKQKQDPETVQILEGMADRDPDGAVRQAAKEALKTNV